MRTARWWSTSASDRRVAGALLATVLVLALAGCEGHDRASAPDAVPAATDDVVQGTLPAPQAAPGSSVTGMPTAPPVAAAVASEPATAAPAPAPLPAPVDSGAASAPGAPPADANDPSPAAPPPSPADAAAASSVVTQYVSSLASGALARGQQMWSTTPNDSVVLQLARNSPFDVSVGGASSDAGGHVAVPVDVRGKGDDGKDRHVVATYTVQRNASGGWQIISANVRDVGS